MSIKTRSRGFTLLEVLIALLVFSLGLLGMAAMLIVSVKTNHTAYLRTQASFLAQSLADRMRANIPRVWTGDYDGGYPSGGGDPCAGGAACSRANVAVRDKSEWSTQLTDLLPNSSATLQCTQTGAVTTTEAENGAPYDGYCDLTIQWSEAALDQQAAGPDTQTFAWRFQP